MKLNTEFCFTPSTLLLSFSSFSLSKEGSLKRAQWMHRRACGLRREREEEWWREEPQPACLPLPPRPRDRDGEEEEAEPPLPPACPPLPPKSQRPEIEGQAWQQGRSFAKCLEVFLFSLPSFLLSPLMPWRAFLSSAVKVLPLSPFSVEVENAKQGLILCLLQGDKPCYRRREEEPMLSACLSHHHHCPCLSPPPPSACSSSPPAHFPSSFGKLNGALIDGHGCPPWLKATAQVPLLSRLPSPFLKSPYRELSYERERHSL